MTKKEILFTAGAKLFAERTYDAVGIREIAAEAGVTSAMLSYHFGGKSGLLREIFSRFSTLFREQMKLSLGEAKDHYELCELSVPRLLYNARENRSIYIVGLRELNRDTPELQDLRDELDTDAWDLFYAYLEKMKSTRRQDESIRDIPFTAIMGMIFSDYLLGDGALIDDDEMVNSYAKVIIELLQHGSPKFWG